MSALEDDAIDGARHFNRWPAPKTETFESAMSALTYAVGLLERTLPADAAQHNRLTDQIIRLETVENRSRRMISLSPSSQEQAA